MQEVSRRGALARLRMKDSKYNFFWVGNNYGTNGVGMLEADKVYDVKQVSDRIILIKLLVEDTVLAVLSAYVHQTGLENSTKDAFYDCLETVISNNCHLW